MTVNTCSAVCCFETLCGFVCVYRISGGGNSAIRVLPCEQRQNVHTKHWHNSVI